MIKRINPSHAAILRYHAEMIRRRMGGHNVPYKLIIDSAEEIERLRGELAETKADLQTLRLAILKEETVVINKTLAAHILQEDTGSGRPRR